MMTTLPSFGRFYRSLARGAAEISYSLYLTHFPLLTLIIMIELSPFRFQPGLLGIVIYLGLLSTVVAWAVVFWWCFERHTDRLFRYLSTQLLGWGWMPPSGKLGSHPQNNG
jgi:peptidoglycan/LPS O-acetylase OafA/YrhL